MRTFAKAAAAATTAAAASTATASTTATIPRPRGDLWVTHVSTCLAGGVERGEPGQVLLHLVHDDGEGKVYTLQQVQETLFIRSWQIYRTPSLLSPSYMKDTATSGGGSQPFPYCSRGCVALAVVVVSVLLATTEHALLLLPHRGGKRRPHSSVV